jgi:two-component system nitrogen regulation response regulator NtrX
VLLDIWMPRLDGMDALARIKELYPELAVVMISGHGTIETAVRATKLGAFDFIEKPLSLEKVLVTVHNAIGMSRLQQENASLRGMMEDNCELIGDSEPVRLLREQIRVVASTSASILIYGESGTGKSTVAHEIHRCSGRSEKPFITLNCAAIPEELIDAELFGNEKGAFPGATSQRKGRVDFADEGTLFLDEITELPLSVQHKVHQLIERKQYLRVGGTKPHAAHVRIMAGSCRSLDEAVQNGVFSEDLYFQLNVVPFDIVPLRERKIDIPVIASQFLEYFSSREMRDKKSFSPEAVQLLSEYDWPGNIREMKNIMERLAIMSHGSVIAPADLPEFLTQTGSDRKGQLHDSELLDDNSSLRGARESFEREFIIQKLEENDWNITKTAEAIDLERSNLHRKIRSYGIEMRK